jgi:hypothetical protein
MMSHSVAYRNISIDEKSHIQSHCTCGWAGRP